MQGEADAQAWAKEEEIQRLGELVREADKELGLGERRVAELFDEASDLTHREVALRNTYHAARSSVPAREALHLGEGRLEELPEAIRGLYSRGETLRIRMTELGRQADMIWQDMAVKCQKGFWLNALRMELRGRELLFELEEERLGMAVEEAERGLEAAKKDLAVAEAEEAEEARILAVAEEARIQAVAEEVAAEEARIRSSRRSGADGEAGPSGP